MDAVLHKDELFGDKYKAFVLCEYTRELELEAYRSCVGRSGNQTVESTWSFEGVC